MSVTHPPSDALTEVVTPPTLAEPLAQTGLGELLGEAGPVASSPSFPVSGEGATFRAGWRRMVDLSLFASLAFAGISGFVVFQICSSINNTSAG